MNDEDVRRELMRASLGYWPTIEGEGPWRKRVVLGPDPAAGAEVSVTVDQGRLWIVHSIRIVLVTDATVANRFLVLQLDDGTSVFFEATSSVAHAASATVSYLFSSAGFWNQLGGTLLGSGLFVPCVLLRGFRIRTATAGLQAGDNFGRPTLYVDELMER